MLVTLLAGCALPPLSGRSVTLAYTDTVDTQLGRDLAPHVAAHPGETGIYPLRAPRDAFAARLVLAETAQRSIDAQYYIWKDDDSGVLLLEALWHAADRGVRVRLLLDDLTSLDLDPTVAALAAHKNIEIRLFNPVRHRRAVWLNFILDFGRVSRRMHNKSFTVDNQASVLGGRNIGDEYFHSGKQNSFDDLDVIAVGPAVAEVSKQFDDFWNSSSAYPAEILLRGTTPTPPRELIASFAANHSEAASKEYLASVRETPLLKELSENRLDFDWSPVRLVYDDPRKITDRKPPKKQLMLSQLLELTGKPQIQFDLISPYLIPRKEGERRLANLARGGVRVRILTNSLSSNDVTAVHSAYLKYRKPLLRAGVNLYEYKRQTKESPPAQVQHKHQSATYLHAKTFQIDGRTAFVGSFNFDPRSARLNTEMGLVIDSSQLAHRISSFFDSDVPSQAYHLRLDSARDLQWVEGIAGSAKLYCRDPETSFWRRAQARMLSILPIEGQL